VGRHAAPLATGTATAAAAAAAAAAVHVEGRVIGTPRGKHRAGAPRVVAATAEEGAAAVTKSLGSGKTRRAATRTRGT
jgi:hypothetical protein